MTKGFVLSLDALLATLVLIVFTVAFAFFSAQAAVDPLPSLVLKKEAGDMLTVMDKLSIFQSLNSTRMNDTLNATLQYSASWSLEVSYYNYSNGFVLDHTINVSKSSNTPVNPVVVEREFLVLANNTVMHYGVARLTLWTQ
jgi:hypothetical protein